MSEINVTPFVDVMLVLLIIFMVAAPLLTAGVAVDLPKSKADTLPTEPIERVTVSVDAAGAVYLGEEPIETEALLARLDAEVADKSTQRIFVRGDASVNYGAVMAVIGELTSAGFTNIGFVTAPVQPAADG